VIGCKFKAEIREGEGKGAEKKLKKVLESARWMCYSIDIQGRDRFSKQKQNKKQRRKVRQ